MGRLLLMTRVRAHWFSVYLPEETYAPNTGFSLLNCLLPDIGL
jgi:hypothetical protein